MLWARCTSFIDERDTVAPHFGPTAEFAGSDLDGNGAVNLVDFATFALSFEG